MNKIVIVALSTTANPYFRPRLQNTTEAARPSF